MADTVLDTVENAYDSIGLMRGEQAPMKRFLFTGGVLYTLVWLAQPRSMFDEAGNARAWSVISPEDPNATTFPHYLVPLIGGFVGGFLI